MELPSLAQLYGSTRESRDVPVNIRDAALLVIDVQRYCALPGEGYHSHVDPNNIQPEWQYFFSRMKSTTIPAIQQLLAAFRSAGGKGEVVYTYIESLTKDGRDRSLDYKLSGFNVAKGASGALMIEEVAPLDDEILIPKSSCSVFCSTNIEYVLRNLGVKQVVIVGIVTNQCVESAVRDAADKGFLVTVVEEACATSSELDHLQALKNIRGFARIQTVEAVIGEVEKSSEE